MSQLRLVTSNPGLRAGGQCVRIVGTLVSRYISKPLNSFVSLHLCSITRLALVHLLGGALLTGKHWEQHSERGSGVSMFTTVTLACVKLSVSLGPNLRPRTASPAPAHKRGSR